MSAEVPVYLKVRGMDTYEIAYITIQAVTIKEAKEKAIEIGEFVIEASYDPLVL